jgi:endonuclease/exonuclease/phosphatase family metal-dependent hydrolase
MAKQFSVASWNVEHFKEEPTGTRIARVVDFMRAQNPDVFGLYEVEGATVFDALVEKMPNYTFQISEGVQTQEILIGVKTGVQAFITQRTEFRSGTTHMRPGQLVTITKGPRIYSLLFLHLASGTDPRGMGLRDDMLERAFDLRKVLDDKAGGTGKAAYIFVGDLNTMGMQYPFDRSIPSTIELQKWDKYATKAKVDMRRLVKTHDFSWFNGSTSSLPPSNLDHVYASKNVKFKTFVRPGDGTDAEVALRGWVDQPTPAKKDDWIAKFSDHSLVYFEVHH